MPSGDRPTTADRARYFLSSYFAIAVGLCVLVALGGLVVALGAHTGPDTTTEQRVVATWSSQSDFRHGAVVQRDARVFDRGDVLHNRSAYFSTVTPILNGSYVYRYRGDGDPASVTTDLRLVVRTVGGQDGDDVLWRDAEPLATVESGSLSPNETHRVPFEFNATAQFEFARAVQADLGATTGRIQVLVVAETVARTTLAGRERVDRRTEELLAEPIGSTYRVGANLSGEHSSEVSNAVEVPVETDPLRAYGSLIALLAGLAGAAGLLWARRTDRLALPAATRAAIGLRRERDSFDEWVSGGRVPEPADGERVVVVESLTDLVDVAIDSNRRVIEDATSGDFVVFDGETRYAYRSGGGPGPVLGPPTDDGDLIDREIGGDDDHSVAAASTVDSSATDDAESDSEGDAGSGDGSDP